MAVSKIKAIKSTLEKAIKYITNQEKTDNGTLVSSFGCAPETAALEFQITAKKGSQNGNRVGYHLIQSFAPEDVLDAKKAHELGMEFAKKVTNGKYEFVISTHVDRGHIHNHIIFNATSFVDKKKYHYGTGKKIEFAELMIKYVLKIIYLSLKIILVKKEKENTNIIKVKQDYHGKINFVGQLI